MTDLETQSKLLGETPRVDAAEFIIADADKPAGPDARWRVVEAKLARQIERENAVLRAALAELLSGHDNLYVAHWGPDSDPENDIATHAARAALKPHVS